MFEIDRIPQHVWDAVVHIPLSPETMKLAMFCDKNLDQEQAEVYLFADDKTLYSIVGKQADGSWQVETVEQISLGECESFLVEEQVSTARLLSRGQDGARLVACFSNSCMASAFVFVKYLSYK